MNDKKNLKITKQQRMQHWVLEKWLQILTYFKQVLLLRAWKGLKEEKVLPNQITG